MSLPETKTIDVAGQKVAWREAGSGPALLLLHGIGAGSRAWGAQLDHFSDRFRVIAWDAPGYGESDDMPMDAPMIADYSEIAFGLSEALETGPAYFCGNSLGSLMISALVRRHPAQVKAMVLSDAAAGHGMLSPEERHKKLRARLEPIETDGPVEMAKQRSHRLCGPAASPEVHAKIQDVMSRVRVKGYSQAAGALAEGNIFVELEGCTTPALVVCGSEDVVTPPDLNRQVADAIPGSRFELVEGAGHQPYVETPEIFNALVDRFLAEQGGAA